MRVQFEEEEVQAILERIVESLKASLPSRPQDYLLDLKELSKYLKVKPQWIYQKVREGSIPYLKAGKYLRFSRSKIDDWLKENGNN